MTEATGAIKRQWSSKLAVGITLQGKGFKRRCVCGFALDQEDTERTKRRVRGRRGVGSGVNWTWAFVRCIRSERRGDFSAGQGAGRGPDEGEALGLGMFGIGTDDFDIGG